MISGFFWGVKAAIRLHHTIYTDNKNMRGTYGI